MYRAAPQGAGGGAPGRRRALRVLFLEAHAAGRGALALAAFQRIRQVKYPALQCEAELAAMLPLGDPGPVEVDGRARLAGERMGLQVPAAPVRAFRELEDAMDYDLLLVLDAADHSDCLQRVAAFDRIDPDGFYSIRVRRLGGFTRLTAAGEAGSAAGGGTPPHWASSGPGSEPSLDIPLPDPLYFNSGTLGEQVAALRASGAQVAQACQGLLDLLYRLQFPGGARGGVEGAPIPSLPTELAQLLRVSATGLGPQAAKLLERDEPAAATFRPTWQAGHEVAGEGEGEECPVLHTVYQTVSGASVVRRVRCPGPLKPRGFWLDLGNVALELEQSALEREASTEEMPLLSELRRSGRGQLAHAISKYHGGAAKVASILGLRMRQKPAGYWQRNIPELKTELAALGGGDGQLPSQRRLRELGRSDLINAVQRLGGAARAADLLELKARPRGRAHRCEAPM